MRGHMLRLAPASLGLCSPAHTGGARVSHRGGGSGCARGGGGGAGDGGSGASSLLTPHPIHPCSSHPSPHHPSCLALAPPDPRPLNHHTSPLMVTPSHLHSSPPLPSPLICISHSAARLATHWECRFSMTRNRTSRQPRAAGRGQGMQHVAVDRNNGLPE